MTRPEPPTPGPRAAAGAPAARGELPGLAAQRTMLAWERTALGVLASGALLLSRDASGTRPMVLVPVGAALLLALGVALAGLRRRRAISRGVAGPPAGRRVAEAGTEVLLLGVGLTLLGALALLAVLAA